MVPALILVLAAWCPITTTTTTTSPERPRCLCDTTTTSTTSSTTTTTEPRLIIHPDPFPPAMPPTTAITGPPVIVEPATATRRPAKPHTRELPVTGADGATLVVAGTLILAGGLLVACRPGSHPR